jgi:hypothetical protein
LSRTLTLPRVPSRAHDRLIRVTVALIVAAMLTALVLVLAQRPVPAPVPAGAAFRDCPAAEGEGTCCHAKRGAPHG